MRKLVCICILLVCISIVNAGDHIKKQRPIVYTKIKEYVILKTLGCRGGLFMERKIWYRLLKLLHALHMYMYQVYMVKKLQK